MSGVKVRSLRFGYDERTVLKDVSFEVNEGEILTILGPNGSGKTTLLKCLNRLLKPKGTVFIDSFEISGLNEKELAKFIGYVPQIHSPAFPYKVVDVVVSGRTPHLGLSMPTKKDYELAYDVLGKLGLGHLANRPYTQLSGGELRLVLIARALIQRPKILLLDEPTSHLDLKNRVSVLKVLKEIAKEGIAVIMSEHDPNLASLFSDKVLLMSNGGMVGYGNVRDVLTRENLMKVYGVDVKIFENNGKRYIFPVIG
ncbi:ABC transporter ATP-binding protein [Archaeoglobus neptunius]|uniref:ABC transporter ATP-binding protein n=1 Tax=Archaeoglobus neptunius TaxID=2798580 RepID=UPI001926FB14|nr:ABC transporter ATP-binding protein [Archaeoglobus neptunius]